MLLRNNKCICGQQKMGKTLQGLEKVIRWRQSPPDLKKFKFKQEQDGQNSLRGGTEAKVGKL